MCCFQSTSIWAPCNRLGPYWTKLRSLHIDCRKVLRNFCRPWFSCGQKGVLTQWQRAGSANVHGSHICRLKTCSWFQHAEYLNRYYWKTMFSHFSFLYKAKVIFIQIFKRRNRIKDWNLIFMSIFEIFLNFFP